MTILNVTHMHSFLVWLTVVNCVYFYKYIIIFFFVGREDGIEGRSYSTEA